MVSFMTGPALLESVQCVLQDPDIFELILVDNGNLPGARHRLSQLIAEHEKVRVLQGHGNIGFSKGSNYGATMATGDYLLFLNPDALIKPMSARRMVEGGTGLTRPWIVGGKLLDIHGLEQRGSRRRGLTPWSAFFTFTGLSKIPGFRSIHMETEPLPLTPTPVSVVSGAFLMLDRASFDRIRGFDERYFLHVEDIDLCHRIHKVGGDVLFVPGASAMHYGSTSELSRWRVEWDKCKGFVIYFVRYSDRWWGKALALIASPAIVVAVMGRAGWSIVKAGLSGL
jgi:GT2 family glycosyltransferase